MPSLPVPLAFLGAQADPHNGTAARPLEVPILTDPLAEPAMSPSVVDARIFFEALYSDVGAGYIEIRPLLDGSDPKSKTEEGMRLEARARRWFLWPRETAACARHCADLDGRFHVYFGVALRKRDGGGRKADVGCATAVFADVDFKDVHKDAAHAALKEFPLAPSACVRSGNGVHVYWFLSEPVFESRFAELERVNRAALVRVGAQVGPAGGVGALLVVVDLEARIQGGQHPPGQAVLGLLAGPSGGAGQEEQDDAQQQDDDGGFDEGHAVAAGRGFPIGGGHG